MLLRRTFSIGHANFILKILANFGWITKSLVELVGKLYFTYDDPQFTNPFMIDFAEEIFEPDEIIKMELSIGISC